MVYIYIYIYIYRYIDRSTDRYIGLVFGSRNSGLGIRVSGFRCRS